MIPVLLRASAAIYHVERAIVALILSVMGVVVFLDVAHRVSTREGSWLAEPVVIGTAAAVIGVLACKTRGRARYLPEGVAIGVAVGISQFAYVRLVENGLIWSQTLALALTLWLGNLGASLAAYERRHLAMDIGSKLWPPTIAPKVAALGHWITALFCLGLVYLGYRSVADHWALWSSSDGAAGNLSGIAIPKWFPALSIPYGMGMLAFRFALDGARTWAGELGLEEDDPLHQLGLKAEETP